MSEFGQYVEITDEETLNAVVRHWQAHLGIADWDISARFAPEIDMQEDAWGSIHIYPPKRAARISIMRPEDRAIRDKSQNGNRYFPHSRIEQDVVHELLHVWWDECGHKANDDSEDTLKVERAIHALTMGFTRLHSYFDVCPGMRQETNPPPVETGA